jgi:hypothetical protein
MKMDVIQSLLVKYQEGTITREELEKLGFLTRKEEVMEEAFDRANVIVRRRMVRNIALALTGVIVLGAGVWMMNPGQENGGLTAQTEAATTTPAVVEDTPEEVRIPSVQEVKEMASPIQVASADEIEQVVAEPRETNVIVKQEPKIKRKPVVVCNTQCDADAVINDIWKFLSA